ncbi:MAG: outer membrane beta-barrel protein [Treponema sp.]|jgi:opacity protein-like surface antigen|nr:outer membrane beta-barrel protein [Treponema sp.]
MANKRFWFVLLIAILVLGSAFAQSAFRLSVGVGGFADLGMGGGYEVVDGGQSTKVEAYMPGFAGGAFALFDATFVELSLGFSGGLGRFLTGSDLERTDFSVMDLNISLLGKYPFKITESFSIFPLLGIDYQIMLSVKDEDGNDFKDPNGKDLSGDFSALWFKLGAGLDYSFTEQIYLRFSALYGIRLPNQIEKDMVDFAEQTPNVSANMLLGQGLTAKLAVGYRF